MSKLLAITMPDELAERFEVLMKRVGAKGPTELITKSLHLMEVLADADDKGLELWTVWPIPEEFGHRRVCKQILVEIGEAETTS